MAGRSGKVRDSSHRAAPVPHADRHAGAIRRARGNEAAANFIRQAKCPRGGRRCLYTLGSGVIIHIRSLCAICKVHAGLGARAAPSPKRLIVVDIF